MQFLWQKDKNWRNGGGNSDGNEWYGVGVDAMNDIIDGKVSGSCDGWGDWWLWILMDLTSTKLPFIAEITYELPLDAPRCTSNIMVAPRRTAVSPRPTKKTEGREARDIFIARKNTYSCTNILWGWLLAWQRKYQGKRAKIPKYHLYSVYSKSTFL